MMRPSATERPRPRLRNGFRTALCWTAFVLLSACASGPGRFLRRPSEPIGWPPGSAPRVELLFAYHSTRDVERHPGFWASITGFFTGTDEIQLVSPYGMALDGDEHLWIADPGASGLHRLSLRTGEHRFFRKAGDTKLRTPIGVTIGPAGNVYVTDSTLERIFVLDGDGDLVRRIGDPPALGRPTGIAYDPHRNRLLVLDTTGGRLLALSLDGKLLRSVGRRGGGQGEFNFPTNLCVGRDGRIYVSDSMNFRVQILGPDLKPEASFGTVGRGPGTFASPKGVAVDSQGHIYVADAMFDNIQIFDRSGRLLLAVGGHGSSLGQFTLPSALYIDPKDRIFVADSGNARFQVLQFHSRQP